jgi:tRNA(Ile)-lysidine synthase
MTDFLDSLRNGLASLQIQGRRLLVAVSGGADSVALLRGLVEFRRELSLDLNAAHLDHHNGGPVVVRSRQCRRRTSHRM